MAQKEIKALTGIRGILAIRVLFDHYFEYDIIQKLKRASFPLKNLLMTLIERGYFSVDLFFLLSSFVLSIVYSRQFETGVSPISYRKFMYKRVVRLFPFYLFNILLFGLLIAKKLTVQKVFINLFYLQSFYDIKHIINPATWSLSVEFMMYLFFPYFFFWFNRLNFNRSVCLLVTISLFLYFLNQILPPVFVYNLSSVKFIPYQDHLGNGFGLTAISRGFSGFLLGILAFKLYKNAAVYQTVLKYRMPIIGSTLALFFVPNVALIIPYFLVLNVILLTGTNNYAAFFEKKWVYLLGNLSFSIYLNHLMVRQFFTKFIWENAFNFEQRILIFTIEVLVTLVFSYLTYLFFEIPVNGFFKKHIIKAPAIYLPIERKFVVRNRARLWNRISVQED